MESSIVKIGDGYSLSSDDTSLSLSNAELACVGCRNCVWDVNGFCSHAGNKPGLICPEMVEFLFSLVQPGESSSSLWERYNLYVAQLQVGEDYVELKRLQSRIARVEKELRYNKNENNASQLKNKLNSLNMDKTAARLWWSRLNEHTVKGFQKVCDREQKAKESTGKLPGILNSGTINFNVDGANSLEHKQEPRKVETKNG